MTLLIFLYGTIIGSFLNVCIYRLPRKESIAFPPSHCPSCDTQLKWYNLIPVISFIVQAGRCGNCREKISLQYPVVELLNGIIFIILFKTYGLSIDFLFYGIISSVLIVITFIDLEHLIIPDILVIIIFSTSVLYKILNYFIYNVPPSILDSLGGMFLAGGLFLLIIVLSKGGMGGGDFTLISALGFILGIKMIFLTIFLSFILGAVISVFLLLSKIKNRKDPIPFGPFIILGFFISLLWGQGLLDWYFNLLI